MNEKFFLDQVSKRIETIKKSNQEIDFDMIYNIIYDEFIQESKKISTKPKKNQDLIYFFYKIIKKYECFFSFPPILQEPEHYEKDIFIACKKGEQKNVQWLVQNNKAVINEKAEQTQSDQLYYKYDTPLHVAALHGYLSIVQYLIIKAKADIEIKGAAQLTPLHYACEKGNLSIVEFLVSSGANIEAKDSRGRTPLQLGSKKGHLNVDKYLVSKGVDLEARDDEGRTSLHRAARLGHVNVVLYLLSKGADKYARTYSGKTPFDLTPKEYIQIKKILQ